jgi:hypothetical protein
MNSLLDFYLIRPGSALLTFDIVQRISEHCVVLLDVESIESGVLTQEKELLPAYLKTNVTGLQHFLWRKLPIWATNGSCVGDIWERFNDIIF